MDWLRNLDVGLFRFINGTISNPFLDWLMPLLSQNPFAKPARWYSIAIIALAGTVLVCRKRYRVLACIAIAGIAIGISDGVVCNTIKHVVGRPRPFSVLPGVNRPGSMSMGQYQVPAAAPTESGANGDSKTAARYGVIPANATSAIRGNSMPSSHAANCFAAALVVFVFYRWTAWLTVPIGTLVAFSRIYNGVHYPSDVVAGAILGAGTAAALVWLADWAWVRARPRDARQDVKDGHVEDQTLKRGE